MICGVRSEFNDIGTNVSASSAARPILVGSAARSRGGTRVLGGAGMWAHNLSIRKDLRHDIGTSKMRWGGQTGARDTYMVC
jgi:hypothetical protein